MSDEFPVSYGLAIAFGIPATTVVIFLLARFLPRICDAPRPAQEPEASTTTSAENVDDLRPRPTNYSNVTIRFFEEFGINGYQRSNENQVTRQTREIARPNDVLPDYHEVIDANLPSYHEAVRNTEIRIENERY